MRKIRTFFYVLQKSASEPAYYLHILRAKFSFSVKFFVLLLFILSIVDVVVLRLRDVPQFIADADRESSKAMEKLPASFRVSYGDGKMTTTGVALPLSIPSGEAARNRGLGNTLAVLTADEKDASGSFLTLTPTRLLVHGTTDIPMATQEFPYKEVLDGRWSLTKSELEGKRIALIASLPDTATIFSVFLIPVWFAGLLLGTTFMLMFLTLLTNTFGWLMGVRLPLVKTLQLGTHAIGVATLLDVLKFILFPFAHVSLVVPGYLGIMVLVFWSLRSVKNAHIKP